MITPISNNKHFHIYKGFGERNMRGRFGYIILLYDTIIKKFSIVPFPRAYQNCVCAHNKLKKKKQGFPGGLVVKTPTAKAGETGLVPDLEDPMCNRVSQPMHQNYSSAPSSGATLLKPSHLEPEGSPKGRYRSEAGTPQ